MKMSRSGGLFACVVLVALAGVAQAGGLAEPVREPYVAVPGDATEKVVVPVAPVPHKTVSTQSCRWVTVAVTVTQPQHFVNQGLSVSGCCCGTVVIPGNSFSLGGQSSAQQELVCDGKGNS